MRQLVTVAVTLVTACGPADRTPTFDTIPTNQVAYVGAEYDLTLRASDPEGDALTFSFSAPAPKDLASRASITQYGDGTARFAWKTPQKADADLGSVAIDFSVTDGHSSVTQTVTIQVKSSTGNNQTPQFVAPLGYGTTLDITRSKCLDLDVTVQDANVAGVEITQAPPLIDGATLMADGPFGAKWHWCPSAAQVQGADVYTLVLAADDGATKIYRIVLKKPSCTSGSPPSVSSSPANVSTGGNVAVTAQVSDDKGLKDPPTLYFSTTAPGTPVDVTQLMPLPMTLKSGTMMSGTFGADVPNPAAAGQSATLYYVVVAVDSDDPTGSCDHTTQSPLYHLTVTNPGGAGNLAPCAPCSHDLQCGGDADNCVLVGGVSSCGKTCGGDGDCPQFYGCQMTTSIDGVAAKQCVPKSGSCTIIAPPTCDDDALEPNDSIDQASTNPSLQAGTAYGEQSCPDGAGGTNPDWYRIDLIDDSDITIALAGGSSTDLDLQLTDSSGNLLAISSGTTSNETITKCLAAGTYYAKVYSSSAAPAANSYTLSYSGANQSCTPVVCTPDLLEPDDDPTLALDATPGGDGTFRLSGRNICVGDVDWYVLFLSKGQTLYVSLTFTQITPDQDLDLAIWAGQTLLTPCDDTTPCSPATGQSSDSNEYYVHTATADADYYIAVLGYGGSQNDYDICVSLTKGKCPVYP